MPHFRLSFAPGAALRMHARISRNFFCVSLGAAAMYSVISLGRIFWPVILHLPEISEAHYFIGAHVRHSVAPTGAVNGSPVLKRIIPSEVEQKLLVPVLLSTGVATTTYSLAYLHLADGRNPEIVSRLLAPRISGATRISKRIINQVACSTEKASGPRESGPRVARLGVTTLLG